MSALHSRVLARALVSTCLRPSPAASISISSHDLGASRSLLLNRNHHLTSNIQWSPNQMYSSLTNGLLLPSRKETTTKKSHSDPIQTNIRTNFSFAGPRKLSDILKVELLDDKSSAEISDLWSSYHEGKDKVLGLTLDQASGKSLLSRAAQCPFFIHPVFREKGHFMILSQFQAPNYFLLTLLEDYRLDPARAQPVLTISIFDDFAEGRDVNLVRCDIINQGIEEEEEYKICKHLLDDYVNEEDFKTVHLFNKKPDAFDVDAFVKSKERRWTSSTSGGSDTGDGAIEVAENKE